MCDNEKYYTCEDIANAFAQFLKFVYGLANEDAQFSDSNGRLGFSLIEQNELLKSIKELKPKKSTGSDKIPACIYKGLAEYIVKPNM